MCGTITPWNSQVITDIFIIEEFLSINRSSNSKRLSYDSIYPKTKIILNWHCSFAASQIKQSTGQYFLGERLFSFSFWYASVIFYFSVDNDRVCICIHTNKCPHQSLPIQSFIWEHYFSVFMSSYQLPNCQ